MAELRTKIRKTQYWLKHDLFTLDNIVTIIALALCLIWTWGAIQSMSRNWALSQELVSKQRERALLELEVETLELENEYYHSDEYRELAARKYQGKMLAGESMVYLPPNSEYARSKHQTSTEAADLATTNEMSNFAQWMKFLFGI